MISKCKDFYLQFREIITYLFFGLTTTMINWCVYIVLTKTGYSTVVANSIGWACGVVYSFITNKWIVFESKSMKRSIVLKEQMRFLLAY